MNTLMRSSPTLRWIGGAVALGLGIYVLSTSWLVLLDGAGFMAWRKQVILLSGAIAWILMTICMVIALRPLWLDRLMGGIDKAYGVHKWAGITAMITLVLHWLMHEVPKWLVNWGWLIPGRRAGGGSGADPGMWATLAKPVGEWAFYAFVVVAVLALVKYFPYRLFSKVHKVFPVIYLAGAYHALAILPTCWWRSPAAYLVVALTAVGSYAAIISLTQMVGLSRKVQAVVTQVRQTASGIVEVSLQLAGEQRLVHQAGQFAFVDFGLNHEGPHPFTIASADPQALRFMIKPLGDFTSQLNALLKPGQHVQIEGPYGQFDFRTDKPQQVWVAAGIGVAPFIARLEQLAAQGHQLQNVDFWYCTYTVSENLYPYQLDALCAQTGVRLHRMVAERGQQLSAEIIRHTVPDISRISVWFCGPVGFARALCDGLSAAGLEEKHFHAERFEMR